MSKQLYECEKTYSDSKPIKNQYTIVYENKTYYYCKVNGTDELRRFEKSGEDIVSYRDTFWSTKDFDLTERVKRHEDEQRQREIKNTQFRIAEIERERIRLQNKFNDLNNELTKLIV